MGINTIPSATEAIWATTDFPYMCLKDRVRTTAFREAIRKTVRPGDIVVDAGAGTGILSFFAARAGAAKVYAVEYEPLLAECLATSISLNGLDDVITIAVGDAREVDLPRSVDVVIGELIDTALMDEQIVDVMNAFHRNGVIGENTKIIPQGYETFFELVESDDIFYGFRVAAPKHEWPFYESDSSWHPTKVRPLTTRVSVCAVDFRSFIDPRVDKLLRFQATADGVANAARISGSIQLSDHIRLGATNAVNGDKVVHLTKPAPVRQGLLLPHHEVAYMMGGGLGSFSLHPLTIELEV